MSRWVLTVFPLGGTPAVARFAVHLGSPAVVHGCGHHLADFNIASTAGWYSALAGLLAGFAFSALVAVVNARLNPALPGTEGFATASQVLVVSFIGLILTSISYAVMSGGTAASGRAATEEVVAGAGFATCAILLIYAIVLIFDASERASDTPLRRVSKYLRAIVALLVAPLAVGYVYLGAADYVAVRYGHRSPVLDAIGLGLVVAVFLFGAVLVSRRIRERRAVRSAADYERAVGRFSLIALVVLIFAAAGFAACEGVLGVCDTPSQASVVGLLAATAAVMAVASWNFTRPLPEPDATYELKALTEQIREFGFGEELERSLVDLLSSALSEWRAGAADVAVEKINAFILEIHMLAGRELTTTQVTALVARATDILSALAYRPQSARRAVRPTGGAAPA